MADPAMIPDQQQRSNNPFQTSPAPRPGSSRRPRTGARRPPTARPDTSASGIGELPDQQFFPEGEDLDEDDEDYDDDPEDDVFAFERPITGAAPRVALSESGYTSSRPDTVMAPTTAGTGITGVTGASGVSGVTYGTSAQSTSIGSPVPEATGNMDVGGHLPELTYDREHPPPFSGRENLNNSSFAFMNKLHKDARDAERAARGANGTHRPPTGQSFLSRLQRRNLNTASTAITHTTDWTGTTQTRTSEDSQAPSEMMSYSTGLTGGGRLQAKRSRSSAPLIPSTSGTMTSITSESGAPRRGMSRGSYGMTEMTGDMTVPDGQTTWGDGMGGMMKEASDGGSIRGIDYDLAEEDSPYPEVRASVSNIDDPEMPALTLRSWTMGMFLTVIAGAANVFFFFRTPAPYLSPFIIEVVAYPIGTFLAWTLPIRTFYLPSWLGGRGFSFNPGPFNIKEHTLVIVMSNVGISAPYAFYTIVSAELFYGHDFGVGFSILFVLATQITGFALAGLCRRFVVWPASMIWPINLVVATSLNAFHAEDEGFQGGMSRFRFLMVIIGASFAWYFLPGFLFTALSYFSWVCWIAPNNRVVNELFGVTTGLGMGILTFDWTQITWIGNPLTTPWWAEVNIAIGFVLFYWIVVPILYYTNVWDFAYLPMNVNQAANRFGTAYDIFSILTPDIRLNETAYHEYSPLYLSATFSMTFILAFALSTAVLVHTALHHGPRIYRSIINIKTEADDIHMKLMRLYPEVPDWWYLALFGVCFVLSIVSIEVFHTGFPVWGYVLSILLPVVYLVPAAFIYAMTNQLIQINLLGELIPGYLFESQPLPGVIFKTFSVQTIAEALIFLQDQKLGHYMKIPPRSLFIAQLSAASITCFVQVGVKQLLFTTVADICGNKREDLLTCNNIKVFFTSSVIWGLIGPGRLFSKGTLYHPQVYAAIAGALVPIPLWLWVRKWPRSVFRNVNTPVIINAGFAMPPATGVNYASFLVIGFIFQFVIRRRNFAWWSKYNYVLSSALDVGTALGGIFIFLVLDLPGASLSWWGNTVYQNTRDWNDGAPYLVAPPEGFGANTWQ